jgi:predicted  nucleic acid-binding Zn-ribbon protein
VADGLERELAEVRRTVDGLTYEIRSVKDSQDQLSKQVDRLNKAFFGNGKETEALVVRFVRMEDTMSDAKRTWQIAQGALIVQAVLALSAAIWWVVQRMAMGA